MFLIKIHIESDNVVFLIKIDIDSHNVVFLMKIHIDSHNVLFLIKFTNEIYVHRYLMAALMPSELT